MDAPIIFNEDSKSIITNYNENFSDIICMTNASQLLQNTGYARIENSFANFISGAIENNLNEKFHNSLTELEKSGIISAEKLMSHAQHVKKAKGQAAVISTFAFEVAPLVYDFVSSRLSKKNIIEFIIGWISYINGKEDVEAERLIKNFFAENGINVKPEEYKRIYWQYVNASNTTISNLQLSNTSRRNLSGENISIVAKKIVSYCDLSDNKIKERALEFVSSCLNIRTTNAEEIVEESKGVQEYNSEVIRFSALNFVTYLQPIINSIEKGKQFAYYDANTDRYSLLREQRKAEIDAAVSLKVVDAMNKINPTLAKIYVSIGLAKKSLNPDNNTKRLFDIQDIKKLMKMELIQNGI